jgi:hypothetical protein
MSGIGICTVGIANDENGADEGSRPGGDEPPIATSAFSLTPTRNSKEWVLRTITMVHDMYVSVFKC